MSAFGMFLFASRWFMWRLEALSLATVIIIGLVCVALKGSVSPATAGLALLSFEAASYCAILMNWKAKFRGFVTSLERNIEYMDLSQEAPAVIPGNSPGPGWPARGEIQLAGVSLRYRPDLPLVLDNISLTIGQFHQYYKSHL